MKLHEMQKERAKLIADARAILEKAESESRSMSAEEKAAYDAHLEKATNLGSMIEERQKFTALENEANAAGNRIGEPLPHQAQEKHKYSVLRAIGKLMTHQQLDGLEAEVSQEIVHRRGRKVNGIGFVMPHDIAALPFDRNALPADVQRRAFDTTSGAGGIPTMLAGTWIDVLRARLIVRQAGARVLTDMQGAFAIPRQSGTTTAYWLPESGAPTASNPVVDQVAFTPHTIGAFTDVSRRLVEMTNNRDAEGFVRDDLMAVIQRGIDTAALVGTGNTNQPTGLVNISGVTVVAIGTNGGAPTYAQAVGLETAIANANADNGKLAYITNTKVRGTLKQTPVIGSTFPVFLWGAGGMLNEYPVFVSNLIPSNLTKGTGTALSMMFFGNWDDMILAFWSGLDVIVDPFTGSSSGTVRIVCLQDCDINIRHPESFAVTKDIVTV